MGQVAFVGAVLVEAALAAPEGVQRLCGVGVQGLGGVSGVAWTVGWGFGAVLAGPASDIAQQLGMHTSAVLAVVMILGQLPVAAPGLTVVFGHLGLLDGAIWLWISAGSCLPLLRGMPEKYAS